MVNLLEIGSAFLSNFFIRFTGLVKLTPDLFLEKFTNVSSSKIYSNDVRYSMYLDKFEELSLVAILNS